MRPRRIIAAAGAGAVFALAAPAGAAAPATSDCPAGLGAAPLGFDLAALDAVRDHKEALPDDAKVAYDALLDRADAALGAGPYSVTDKATAGPSGDAHDYVSLATYWWPNPDQPDGLPYVRRDGVMNPERLGANYDRNRSQRMVEAVYDLALAHHLTGNAAYARKAESLVEHWFVAPESRMNPNLDGGQIIPGRNEGRAIGIIDSRIYADLIDAALLLARNRGLSSETQAGLRDWFGAFAAWLIQSEFGKEERAASNNHGTFYDAQLAVFTIYGGRCDLAKRIVYNTAMRAERQIDPEGVMPHEADRTRSLHYHAFNAEAFLRVSLIAERLGLDLYDVKTKQSGSVRDAVHRLADALAHPEAWSYPRIDDRGTKTAWQALMRSRLIADDSTVEAALADHDAGDRDDLLRLLTYDRDGPDE